MHSVCRCCVAEVQGRSQDFTLGATEAERRRRKNRGAEGADGVGIGEVVSFPNRLGDLGSIVSSPSGVWGGAVAANASLTYLRPTEHFW